MLIIENIIPIKEQEYLYSYVSTENFPYRLYRSHRFSSEVDQKWDHAPMQMSHHLYEVESDKASPHLPVIKPLVDEIQKRFNKIQLLRAKVNLTSPYPPMMNYEHQVPHVDLEYDNGDPVDHKVFLYYINDSDGPTYFFNKSYEVTDILEPKQGMGVYFDGSTIHAASNPVNSPFRFVLNIDFKVL